MAQANKYMTDTEPWNIRSHDLEDEAAKARQSAIIYTLAETLRICSILLQPCMPTRAAQALDRLGVDPERRAFEHAVRGADASYGTSFVGVEGRGSEGSLFPPLPSGEFPDEEGEPLFESKRKKKMMMKERLKEARRLRDTAKPGDGKEGEAEGVKDA